ncbi:MAG: alpha-2,8-polysialyltransferase family protein [Gammaproteobacteria bacterium]|nr:alpha-2,8-polysialyltransferase family protein [Gammaproteobacteria bacterium]MCF6230412.1 alpha-2,8-polysialyltransferase family protein [Gammaproteobacteria bacterium]
MKSLYIARSPLQLFNCIEARNRFSGDDENILVAAYKNDTDKNLLHQLIDKNDWNQVYLHSIKANADQYSLIIKLFVQHSKVDTLYIGDYTSSINFYINITRPKKIVMVDDGIATLKIVAMINSGSLHKTKKHLKSKMSVPTIIVRAICQTSPKYLYRSDFFTMYNLQGLGLSDRTITNDYRMFKKNITGLSDEKTCFFIGTSMEDLLISKACYEKYFKILAAYFDKEKWVYVLHRKECAEYVALVAKKFGIPIVRFNNIIESEFFIQKITPTSISSFCSSALDTIEAIYNPKIKLLKFDENDLIPTKKEALRNYYKYQANRGINVIHFNEYTKK